MSERNLTKQQQDCLNRVIKNKRKASRRQLSQAGRYKIVECTACGQFYTESEIHRHQFGNSDTESDDSSSDADVIVE